MAHLQLSLLGAFQCTLDGERVTAFESSKVRALLAYLAMQPERGHNREALTGLLWPDQSQEKAGANLRQALSSLRRLIGDTSAATPLLLVSREAVRLNPEADVWLDVRAFNDLLDICARHEHRNTEACTPCAQRLAQAVTLYGGAFLDGLFVQDNVAFEEWELLQREALHRRVLQALHQLAAYHERRGAYDQAYAYAWRQIELDPWREEAHCQLMRVLVLRGERGAALTQYESCRRLLLEGLGVEPSEATTALYERIRAASGPDEVDAAFARSQLALPSRRPHNLPPQPTPFIGRERELTELAELIERPECRLISLIGQGGSGKTRLALQAAVEQIGAFSDGVYFVSLVPVRSSEHLASAIATALGITFSRQASERAQLLDELQDKEMLLVLDGFEHLLDAADLLVAMLQRAPRLILLVTTRERLNLQGEWTLTLGGLPYPETDTDGDLEDYPAVQLFVQSARRMNSAFVLRTEDRSSVTQICLLVGGLPLAIELAAAWAPVLSSAEIAQEITRNLDFLATRLRDVPERHRSIRAVFDHSWNLMSPEERGLASRLSVFRGGFRREAAEQGAGASLPLLSSLVAKSFLHRDPLGRYTIHELLRQYVHAALQELPAAVVEAQDHHAAYFADFVWRHETRMRGQEQIVAIEEISTEIDNVREAWRWSIDRLNIGNLDKLTDGLWFYYEIQGLWREADEAFGRAITALDAEVNDADLGRAQAIALGKVLTCRATMIGTRLGQTIVGRQLLERSLALFTRYDAHREAAFSLNILGVVARLQCEYTQAKDFLQQSLRLAREAGDRWEIAYSLSDLGNVNYLLGEYEEAMRLHEESLRLSREAGDRRAIIFCLNDMSSVAIALGDYTAALESCEEILAVAHDIGHRWGRANALYQMGSIALYTGEYARAQTLLQESLDAFRATGEHQHIILPLQQAGYVAYLQGDYALAHRLLHETLAICKEINHRRAYASALNALGRLELELEEAKQAWSYLSQALTAATEIQARPLMLDILGNMAEALAGEGQPERARTILAVVLNHPATDRQTRDRVQKMRSSWEAILPTEQITASNSILEELAEQLASAQWPVAGGQTSSWTR